MPVETSILIYFVELGPNSARGMPSCLDVRGKALKSDFRVIKDWVWLMIKVIFACWWGCVNHVIYFIYGIGALFLRQDVASGIMVVKREPFILGASFSLTSRLIWFVAFTLCSREFATFIVREVLYEY